MQVDNRFRNKNFSMDSMGSYLDEYGKTLWTAIKEVDHQQLETTSRLIKNARAYGQRIFVCGNGGSAAIANHLDCDFVKGTYVKGRSSIHVVSLVANQSVLTAIANDVSYDEVFSYQLQMANVKSGELLILVSSSGNSPNIVKACEWANAAGMITIGLTGFTGGRLMEIAQVRLHVPCHNYGVVEDSHQAVMHCLAQYHELGLR